MKNFSLISIFAGLLIGTGRLIYLRVGACYLSKVVSHKDGQLWMRAFIDWHAKYEEYINEKSLEELYLSLVKPE